MLQSELIPGSPDAKLLRVANLYNSSANLHPKVGLKAKLNSTIMATFILHTPPIKAVQSVSKSELLQTFENFEGGLVDT